MKLKRARIGEKFVYPDKTGVWEKLPDGKAKMVFGERELVGKLEATNQEDYVYVIFEGKGQKPNDGPSSVQKDCPQENMDDKPMVELNGGLGSEGWNKKGIEVILTKDEVVVGRLEGVPSDKAMMLSSSDIVKVTQNGCQYVVMDRGFDISAGQLQLEVEEC